MPANMIVDNFTSMSLSGAVFWPYYVHHRLPAWRRNQAEGPDAAVACGPGTHSIYTTSGSGLS